MANELLENMLAALPKETDRKDEEFCVLYHTNPRVRYFKMMLNNGVQFSAEVASLRFSRALKRGNLIELLSSRLITKDKDEAGPTLRETMHNALSHEASLDGFFAPDDKYFYDEKMPVGRHGGNIRFLYARYNPSFGYGTLGFRLRDLSYGDNISGYYQLDFTDASFTDSHHERARLLIMRRMGILRLFYSALSVKITKLLDEFYSTFGRTKHD